MQFFSEDILPFLGIEGKVVSAAPTEGIHLELKKMFEDLGIPMDKLFKKLFLSYEMHLLKPSDEIYQEAIRQIGGEPSEMLFVDDSQINVDAAIRNGMQSICYKPGTCLRTALSEVLND